MPRPPLLPLFWLSVCIVAVLGGWIKKEYNFGKTLRWTPRDVRECEDTDCVTSAVFYAKNDGLEEGVRIIGLGTGWSWSTTIANDDDIYVVLKGPLADASQAVIDLDEPSVIVGGGVQAFDLYMRLQSTGYNIEAKGGCMSSKESQTVGGLLATNVHHTGIKSFYDVVEWVDVVTAGGLVRTYREETLFRLTIGGGGRTGIIVRAKFTLAERATYQNVAAVQQPDKSLKAFFEGFVDFAGGYEPNDFLGQGLKLPGYLSLAMPTSYTGKRRMPTTSQKPIVLSPNYGNPSFLAYPYLFADWLYDPFLPALIYNILALAGIEFVLGDATLDTEGKVGEDLDVAASSSSTTTLKHQEIELFIPVDLAGEVGAYMDKRFDDGAFPYTRYHGLFLLRFVYGCSSLTAANGVLSDGSSPNVVAVNIDSFQRSAFDQFEDEINNLLAELSEQFPMQIRTHPGKYNPPLSPDPENLTVKDLIASYDPDGIFARDPYNATYLTSQRAKAGWWWL